VKPSTLCVIEFHIHKEIQKMANTVYTFTPDMTRPNCPECGAPVETTNTPDIPFKATCNAGHAHTYQMEHDEEL
jgi:hypothetical protein|tara:strand:- start:5441 stop:5662 length:222 start_codon:yes stop_codon:yes gene_type:complete